MTPKEAEAKLFDLKLQLDAGLCSGKTIKDYINYIDVMWDFGVTEVKNERGSIRYEVYEKDLK